jgi:hypothetical protein
MYRTRATVFFVACWLFKSTKTELTSQQYSEQSVTRCAKGQFALPGRLTTAVAKGRDPARRYLRPSQIQMEVVSGT